MATESSPSPSARVQRYLTEPVAPWGLAAFRILFGALMVFAALRTLALGWVRELYVEPSFHFSYLRFEWVKPWPGFGMYLHFALLALSALGIALGFRTRLSAGLFCALFSYVELCDKATYLNHYYLVSLLALLLVFVPSGAGWSLDARIARAAPQAVSSGPPAGRPPQSVPRWAYVALAGQVAVVYFFAGFAKLGGDWLFGAEPLSTWLAAHAQAPLVGAWLAEPWLAYLASWAGAFYDLGIVGFLLWRRTRAVAYATAVLFHVATWLLFPIGVFPWVMLIATTLFFAPDWPRRLLGLERSPALAAPNPPTGRLRLAVAFAGVYVLVQLLVPLRFVAYPGSALWTEQGFRFSWRVMLIEKTGQVVYDVTLDGGRRLRVYPRSELTPLQYKMLSTQPDMIHEYAQHLAARYRERGFRDVRVHADAWASLNGRPSQRLIDPGVDLAAEERSLAPKPWILPLASDGAAVALFSRGTY